MAEECVCGCSWPERARIAAEERDAARDVVDLQRQRSIKDLAYIDKLEEQLKYTEKNRDDVLKENDRLRAMLAFSDAPCAYCGVSKEDWATCKHGFPGCPRADDAAQGEGP